MDGVPLASIPQLALHKGVNRDEINAKVLVEDWLSTLETYLKSKDADFSVLLLEDSWWRDLVGLSWDTRTNHGPQSIGEYVISSTAGLSQLSAITVGGLQPALVEIGGLVWVQGGFTFKTTHGSGRGFVRLANVGKSEWKAWMVYTQLERLDFQDELDDNKIQPWYRDTPVMNGQLEEDLPVLVVGAGQSGVGLAARLQDMGIRTLLVDKLPRLGDFWRGRYETVRAHTPKHTDHYPFLKFPENWPRWLEQSKLADWIEHYGQVMGLSVMLSTKVTNVVYDPSTRRHKVEIDNAQGKRSLYARQVVLATGLYSDIPIRPSFPGEKTFQGQVYHSSKHKAARLVPDLSQKRVAIIGSGTSAHDIAQDFVNNGAKGVSIVQRGPIFSFAAATIESTMYALWNTPGISTEEADVIGNSIPLPVARTLNLGQSQMMAMQDKDLIEGLEKAGVAIQKPEKVGFGFLDHLFIKTGHFYIDQGASAMIVDGRIKIHRCEEGVKEFVEHGFLLGNGTKVQADLVVLATGFEKNMVSVKQLVGEEAGEQLGPVGDLDKEQERVGWWRPTGLPGFWVTAGSFIWVRQMSLVLALQIAAVEKGLVPGYWDAA